MSKLEPLTIKKPPLPKLPDKLPTDGDGPRPWERLPFWYREKPIGEEKKPSTGGE